MSDADLWRQFDAAYSYAQNNIDKMNLENAGRWLEVMKEVAEQLNDSMTAIQIRDIEEQL